MQGNLFYIKLIRNLLAENDNKLNRILAIVNKYFSNKNTKHIKRLEKEFLENQNLKRNEAEGSNKLNNKKEKSTKSKTKSPKKKPITFKIADNDEDEDEDYNQKDIDEDLSDSEDADEDIVDEYDEFNNQDEEEYNKMESLSQQVVPKSKLSTFGSGIFANKIVAKKS